MVSGIIICHGELAFECLNAVETILGPQEHIYPLTNNRLSPDALQEELQALIQKDHYDKLIMVDLRGGSCWHAAQRLARKQQRIRVISGINLPMLISFLTRREQHPFSELLQMIRTDAREGISL